MIRPLLVVALVAAVAPAALARSRTVDGTVAATRAAWAGDTIVTTSDVREATGTVTTVVQLGGVVDGIGMTFSHQPPVLQPGDRVSVDALDSGQLAAVRPLAAGAASSSQAVAGHAVYGLQRTSSSRTALWRDTGCLHLVYDTSTIPASAVPVIDAAFQTWQTATASCGGLEMDRSLEHGVPAAVDGINSIHLRSDRWCRPATASSPELCYAADAAAVTRLVFVDDPSSADDGKILEADIDLDAVNFVLLAPGAAPPTTGKPALYLQAVATHEAGHLLGLAHSCGTDTGAWPTDRTGAAVPSCDDPSAAAQAATMFIAVGPLDDGPSTLAPADITGGCAIASEVACVAEVSGGCAAGGGGGRGWLATIIVGLALVARRGRRGESRLPS